MLAAALLLGAAAGCGGARSATDDLVRAVTPVADDTDALARSRWMPSDYVPPPPSSLPTADEIAGQAARLAEPAADLPSATRQSVVRTSCLVADAVEAAGGDSSDVLAFVASQGENAFAYRVQVEQLSADVLDARSGGELTLVLGQAALCAWAEG